MRAGPERDIPRRAPGIVSGGDQRWQHHRSPADQPVTKPGVGQGNARQSDREHGPVAQQMRGDEGPGPVTSQAGRDDLWLLRQFREGSGEDWEDGAEAVAHRGDDMGDLTGGEAVQRTDHLRN
jgi:hypothetical protein